MTDNVELEEMEVEELRKERYLTERAAALARNEAQTPGAARDTLLAVIDRLGAEPQVDLGELRQALTSGRPAQAAFEEAVAVYASLAGRRLLVEQLREWAASAPLDPDPAQALFGAIRWETAAERAEHVAALRERAERLEQRSREIVALLERREEERVEQEIEAFAQRRRERSTQ